MTALVVVVAVVGYVVSLWIWPFRPCRRCGGRGHVQRIGSRTVARVIRAGRTRRP